jgi:two-component system, NarL family, sensor histidine kinase UhpB
VASDLPTLDHEAELAVYRVAQEALTNIARHASAANVQLVLERSDGGVKLSVSDDGRGIDRRHLLSAAGIAGMRERALLIGGSLDIGPGTEAGTTVHLWVPVR